jgi:hypothetical protein
MNLHDINMIEESDELLLLRMAMIGMNLMPEEIQEILRLPDEQFYRLKKLTVNKIGKLTTGELA